MPNLLVLSPKECHGKAWHPPQDFAFAQHRSLIPLHVGELAKAAAAMPLAAVKEDRKWRLVGVCGLEPGHNLFIRQGQWLGHYQPEWLSTYPFEIVRVGEKGFVTFDQESGLLSEEGQAGDAEAEAFFDARGEMTPAVFHRVEALKAAHRKYQTTHKALSALADAKILAPWPETLQQQMGWALNGLHLVDEKALSQLDNEAFLALRRVRALPIAYALNLSIPQTHLLTRLARMHPAQADAPENLGSFFEDDEELNFDFDS